MAIEVASRVATGTSGRPERPRVVVCGSFRRDTDTLKADFAALADAGCIVLSPRDLDFVAEVDGFVLAAHELDQAPCDIEAAHLDSLQAADFVWLHAPDGYVGPSGALEVGVAHSFGIPVYCRTSPSDIAVSTFAIQVADPFVAAAVALSRGNHTPSRPLQSLQSYYKRVAIQRGFERETAQDTLLLLVEEVGELARAVRKSIGLARATAYEDVDTAAELADVQLYVLHLANVLGVDLAQAVATKERVNATRHRQRRTARVA